ncbi:polyadenylate-binding protein-interacting protein 1-like [Argonauta hians]
MSNPTGDLEASSAASSVCSPPPPNILSAPDSTNMSTPLTSSNSEDFATKPCHNPRYPHQSTLNRRAKDSSESNTDSSENNSSLDGLSSSAPQCAVNANVSTLNMLNSKSVLSATATEFYPKKKVTYDVIFHYSLHDRLPACIDHYNLADRKTDCPHCLLELALYHLSNHPGNIDAYMIPFTDALYKSYLTENSLPDMAKTIFEKSVQMENFAYIGARICEYITSLPDAAIAKKFKDCLIVRCETAYNQRVELISSEATIPRVCRMSLFIAELFLLIKIDRDGLKERINVFGNAIYTLLELLLQYSCDETVKCAAQLMKLAGAALEDYAQKKSLDNIYRSFEQLKGSSKLNKTSNILIDSVLKLKDAHYGRNDAASSSPSSSDNAQPQHNPVSSDDASSFIANEPIFFNRNGQQISRQEAGVDIEVDVCQLLAEVDLEDMQDLQMLQYETDNSMDEEMMNYYEKYLESCKKK